MTTHTKNIAEVTRPEIALAFERSPCTVTYFEGAQDLTPGGREAVILHLFGPDGWTKDLDRCRTMTGREAQALRDRLTAKHERADGLHVGMFAVTLI